MDEEGLKEAEREVLAEEGQTQGEGAGEHGEPTEEGAKPSRGRDARINQLVAERNAERARAETAERAAAEARAAAETAERIARGGAEDRQALSPKERRDLVREKFRAGEIDDEARAELLADIAAEERLVQAGEVTEARQILQATANEIEGWKQLAPEINQQGSELNTRVSVAYRRLLTRGYPADIRTQLTAVESVMGVTLAESRRRRQIDDTTAEALPRGGVGTGGSGGGRRPAAQGSRGEQIFARLTPDALAAFRQMAAYANEPDPDKAIKEDLAHADEDVLWRRGRLTSR